MILSMVASSESYLIYSKISQREYRRKRVLWNPSWRNVELGLNEIQNELHVFAVSSIILFNFSQDGLLDKLNE